MSGGPALSCVGFVLHVYGDGLGGNKLIFF